MYRHTWAAISLNNIKYNIQKIIKKYHYKYYFGVVKADSYALYGYETIKTIIDSGCNYLAVATLDEALEIRKHNKKIPILCLGIIPLEELKLCLKHNITITISNLPYLKSLLKQYSKNKLLVHLKLNTGMNRLGIKDADELITAVSLIGNSNLILEGIYSHLYQSNNKTITQKQLKCFDNLIQLLDYSKIKIIHLAASEGIVNEAKLPYINGCRLGIIMYGFTNNKDIKLKSTFKLYSEIIQINKIKKNETVGYMGKYKAFEDEYIAVIPIGYADGIWRNNTGRFVYINNQPYPIVGNICMDMLFVKVKANTEIKTPVLIIKDNEHIKQIAKHLNTIEYEVLCAISKRVSRTYKK